MFGASSLNSVLLQHLDECGMRVVVAGLDDRYEGIACMGGGAHARVTAETPLPELWGACARVGLGQASHDIAAAALLAITESQSAYGTGPARWSAGGPVCADPLSTRLASFSLGDVADGDREAALLVLLAHAAVKVRESAGRHLLVLDEVWQSLSNIALWQLLHKWGPALRPQVRTLLATRDFAVARHFAARHLSVPTVQIIAGLEATQTYLLTIDGDVQPGLGQLGWRPRSSYPPTPQPHSPKGTQEHASTSQR